MTAPVAPESIQRATKRAIFGSNLLNEPFASLYAIIPFILCKDLNATPFQIALLTMLKPTVSLLSLYWSSRVGNNPSRLRSNVLGAGIIGRLPFLLLPFLSSSWFLIAAAAIYMLFYRAGAPAWVEMLKINLPKQLRERLFSIGSALGYAEGVLLGLAIGALLEGVIGCWKLLFAGSALIAMLGIAMQATTPLYTDKEKEPEPQQPLLSLKERLLDPWKACFELMRTRPDFARFQWGFMAAGFGIMVVQPAIPFFFVNTLNLTYIELEIAINICKGLGVVLSATYWANAMGAQPVQRVASIVFFGFALFPLFLVLAPLNLLWLYGAYLLYGIVQGGSHLIWYLAGPAFCPEGNSARFSEVSIVMVGIRGLIAPALGGILLSYFSPVHVLLLGVFLSSAGGFLMLLPMRPSPLRTIDQPTSIQ